MFLFFPLELGPGGAAELVAAPDPALPVFPVGIGEELVVFQPFVGQRLAGLVICEVVFPVLLRFCLQSLPWAARVGTSQLPTPSLFPAHQLLLLQNALG